MPDPYPRNPPEWWKSNPCGTVFYPGACISLVPDKSPRPRVPAVILSIAESPAGSYYVRRWMPEKKRWTVSSKFDAVRAQFERS